MRSTQEARHGGGTEIRYCHEGGAADLGLVPQAIVQNFGFAWRFGHSWILSSLVKLCRSIRTAPVLTIHRHDTLPVIETPSKTGFIQFAAKD